MEEETEETSNFAVIALSAVVIGAGIYVMKKTARKERAEREKIEAWKQNRINLIKSSRDRVVSMMLDPDVTVAEALRVWREDQKFIGIVCHPSTMDMI